MPRTSPFAIFAATGLCLAAVADVHAQLEPAAPQAATPFQAEATAELTPEQRFKAKLRERDRTYRKLHRLDAQAAAAVKRGEQPLELFAQQQSAQEILNGLELRLTLTGSRYGWEIPEPPASSTSVSALDAPDPDKRDNAQLIDTIVPEGPARTHAVIRSEVNGMLARLTFRGFPQNGDR